MPGNSRSILRSTSRAVGGLQGCGAGPEGHCRAVGLLMLQLPDSALPASHSFDPDLCPYPPWHDVNITTASGFLYKATEQAVVTLPCTATLVVPSGKGLHVASEGLQGEVR